MTLFNSNIVFKISQSITCLLYMHLHHDYMRNSNDFLVRSFFHLECNIKHWLPVSSYFRFVISSTKRAANRTKWLRFDICCFKRVRTCFHFYMILQIYINFKIKIGNEIADYYCNCSNFACKILS
jgi:hypothetical protein